MKIAYIYKQIFHLDYFKYSENFQFENFKFESFEFTGTLQDKSIDNFISESLKTEYDFIFIPLNFFSEARKFVGLELALHIRLSNNSNCHTPIILLSPLDYREVLLNSKFSSVLSTPNIVVCDFDLVSVQKMVVSISLSNNLSSKNFGEDFLRKISVPKPPKVGNHEIANMYGAHKFSKALGIDLKFSDESTISDKTHDLFFKYKLRNFNYQIECSNKKRKNSQKVKIENFNHFKEKYNFLLIDDKAKEGWEFCLRHFLENVNEYNTLDIVDSLNKTSYEKDVIEMIKEKNIDLVFLDLRLFPEEDLDNFKDEFSGLKILKEIKRKIPYTPVIIFTASNKAWNIEKLIQNGADGFYIKESPEFDFPLKSTKESIEVLKNKIKELILKRKYVEKFWMYTNEIIETLDSNNSAISSKIIKKDIKTKLEMSLGYLVKKSTEYEKENFLYLDFELAFLTYFSILNEIIADKKSKVGAVVYINGQEFIKEERKNYYTNIKETTIGKKTYSSLSEKFHSVDKGFSERIVPQIMALIFSTDEYSKDKLTKFEDFLRRSNGARNHHLLIHGSFDENKKTIDENRQEFIKSIKTNCDEIFKVIYFLITKKFIEEEFFDA